MFGCCQCSMRRKRGPKGACAQSKEAVLLATVLRHFTESQCPQGRGNTSRQVNLSLSTLKLDSLKLPRSRPRSQKHSTMTQQAPFPAKNSSPGPPRPPLGAVFPISWEDRVEVVLPLIRSGTVLQAPAEGWCTPLLQATLRGRTTGV